MKFSKLNAAFGRVLARLRKERGWSQEYLGFECELARNYISMLERGERSPTLNTIFRLSKALNVPVDEIVRQAVLDLEEIEGVSREV
ncbi:helix-turn-helix domain-containing protein [Comamonas testosteroni]|jgi:transcriptional regulator with XRE-family HTH domain|uniref:helix-turn-helix domain-containing protein n=1 Tax=Comamonas testosteroni TaxID=285 RepID=UPI0026F0015C|nr:helix-turn-helix transcriptional regulator [Comamonas testosteroni]